ncbi:MAG: DNA translocase FtsK [Bacteroidales bacterium]|nr:DNA translocase FtsK [Bacteroidales bacterium]
MDSFEISSENYDPTTLHSSGVRPMETQGQEKPHPVSAQQPTATSSKPRPQTAEPVFSPGERWKMFLGMVLIVAAVYLLIVSISFFSSGAEDQSIVQNIPYSDVSNTAKEISNTGGPFGAFLSNILMSRWLGIGSFVLIFYLGALGVSLVKIKHFNFWTLTYKCLLSAIVLSILTGFITYRMTSFNYWGGNHGRVINEMLIKHTGLLGAIAVNIILVGAVVLVYLKEIEFAWDMYSTKLKVYKEKLAIERATAEKRKKTTKENLSPEDISQVTQMTNDPKETFEHEPKDIDANPALERPLNEAIDSNNDTGSVIDNIPPQVRAATHRPTSVFADKPEPITVVNTDRGSVRQEFDNLDRAEIKHPIDVQPEPVPQQEHPVNSERIQTPFIPEPEPQTEYSQPPVPEPQLKPEPPKPVPKPHPDINLIVNVPKTEHEAEHIQSEFYDPTAELSHFRSPSIDLLEDREVRTDHVDLAEQEENKARLTETLSTYGVKISHIEATVGPTITRYEVIPAQGERIRSIKSLGDDLALSLAALGIRIIAPIPGKGTIGIEVPNKDPQIVGMKSIFASEKFQNTEYELPIAMGRTITNEIYIADLAKLPHLLVAGATGMGKSVGLNAIIASLLYKKHPAELKFVLIDPKRVELSLYRKLERHYLAALPGEDAIITDTSKVVAVLNSLCIEMGNRLSMLEDAGVRNIKEYNAKFIARKLNPKNPKIRHRFLPYIVLIIDEFADIILTAGKEVENPVSRLAAVARAAGIHLILATQRPAVNVITGGIKTNIPGRIAFRTIQSVDSRTILDRTGAEQLVGKGDMIFSKDGVLERVQCAFIDTDEVKAICDSIGDQIGYDGPYDLPEFIPAGDAGSAKGGPLTDRDPLFEESGRLVIDSNMGSASNLQRKFNIGYPRAGKIMDQLEIAGVVGPPQGGKPRQVLMDMMAFEEYLRNSGSNK